MANQDSQILMDPSNLKMIDHILKVNQRIALSVGPAYLTQLTQIFQQLICVYGHYSSYVSHFQKSAKNHPLMKPMKQVRRDILKLVQYYIENEVNFGVFNSTILPTLQGMVADYQSSDPNARDPETLLLFATILKKEGNQLQEFFPQIVYGLCQPTLDMIKNDFSAFPEFREPKFKLLESMISNCTRGLFDLEAKMFETILHTVIYAMKHKKPEEMEIGLSSMIELITKISNEESVCT
jgi:exportin-1